MDLFGSWDSTFHQRTTEPGPNGNLKAGSHNLGGFVIGPDFAAAKPLAVAANAAGQNGGELLVTLIGC